MTEKTETPHTEGSIANLLHDRYPEPQYAFFHLVRNAPGFPRQVRTADAIAIGLWPSRGIWVHGFEIKCHRSDWIKELNTPEKAELTINNCHTFSVVTSTEDMIKPGELPSGWGHLHVKGKRLTMKTEPVLYKERIPSTAFFASILSQVIKTMTPEAKLFAEYQRGRADGIESSKKALEHDLELTRSERDAIQKQIKEIGDHLEIYFGYRSYTPSAIAELGKLVRLVKHGTHLKEYENLVGLRRGLDHIYHHLGTSLTRIDNEITRHEQETKLTNADSSIATPPTRETT